MVDALTEAGYPPKVGHAFHEVREWEFDLAYPQIKLAIEVDGGGRHYRFAGRISDNEKDNAAMAQGWRVLRYPTSRIETKLRLDRIVEQITRIICGVVCPSSDAEVLTR